METRTSASTHAAFLRAVNLGPRRRASSEDLRAAFEQTGLAGVHTFRTSGNVVFSATKSESELRHDIERALEQRFGFSVPVYLRSAAELRKLAATDPFADAPMRASRKLQVALLNRRRSAADRKRVLAHATEDDLLSFSERELLWLPRAGTQTSALKLRELEKLIGPWTMRTMDTIRETVARYFS
jgi:uncharacterized protein (DUF1697 family)